MAEARAPAKAELKPQVDVYDEEFYNNLQLAKKMVSEIRNKKDKDICKKWIGKLINLKSDDPVVKKNRNSFFRYMLQMLNKAAKEAESHIQLDGKGKKKGKGEDEFVCKWSGDNRTYIAAKPLPGQGTLIYMAVSTDPSLGWDHM